MNKLTKVLISALTTLAICLWINTNHFSPRVEQNLAEESFWINKAHHQKKHDVIIMGDSRALRGINPKELNKVEDVYNFSFRSATFTNNYLDHASKLLNKGGVILVALTPHSFTTSRNANEHFYEYKNQSIDKVFVKKNKILHRLFSPFRDQKFNKNKDHQFNKVFLSNGHVSTDRQGEHFKEGLDVYREIFSKHKFNMTMFKSFLNYAIKLDLKLVFFRMPSCEEMENIENNLGDFDEGKVTGLVRNNGFIWIDFKEKHSFNTYDASHLRPGSAKRFSHILDVNLFREISRSSI
jgi:hypothetical protein